MKRLFLLTFFLVALMSCEKPDRPGQGKKINVRVSAADTKGTVTTTDGLKASGAFSMMACVSDDYVKEETEGVYTTITGGPYFSGNGNVTLSSTGWVISGEYKWVADVYTHFWAWHPVTVSGRSIDVPVMDTPVTGGDKYPYTGELTFSYTTPAVNGTADADNAVDILFAYTNKKYTGDNGESIDLTFHHALSQVRFCVSTDDGTFDKSLIIKNISISNLATSGNASFKEDEYTWDNLSGSNVFGQDYNADFSTSTVAGWTKGTYTDKKGTPETTDDVSHTLYTCENVFFMIPQKVTSSNEMTVVFDYKGVTTTKTVPIADTTGDVWMSDHYYTYKIKATTVGRDIDLSVSLVGWTNRKEEIFI